MVEATKRIDIVIFGATGFTGKYVVHEVLRLSKDKGGLTWGVAGRNERKLQDVLKEVSEKSGEDISRVEIIIADVNKEDSLLSMAEKAKVVVNCTGPYYLYGEPVVKACIASGTHHVDISGEPLYMEKMQLEYNEEAEKKCAYIVSACGFDSIPADLGSVFLQDKFEGTVNSVETFLELWTEGSVKGSVIHTGTWESAVHAASTDNKLKAVRRKLFSPNLPEMKPKLKLRVALHKSDVVQGWCIPFPGADPWVVLRSQRHFFGKDNQRPVQVQSYVALKSLWTVFALAIIGVVLLLMSLCRCGRNLLIKYPRVFSLNFVNTEPPTEETIESSLFAVTIKGTGWSEKITDPLYNFPGPPDKTMTVKVSGRNPAYSSTAIMLVMSAFMCLTESDKMPGCGGVYPPGAAFSKTSIIQKINERKNVKFEVLSKS